MRCGIHHVTCIVCRWPPFGHLWLSRVAHGRLWKCTTREPGIDIYLEVRVNSDIGLQLSVSCSCEYMCILRASGVGSFCWELVAGAQTFASDGPDYLAFANLRAEGIAIQRSASVIQATRF